MNDPSLDRESIRSTAPFKLRPSAPRAADDFSALTPVRSTQTARAVIASRIRLLRDGLSEALSRSTAIAVVGTASDASRTHATIADLEPDLVLLDIEMPDSLTLVHTIHDLSPAPKIVAFAVSDIDDALVAYIEAGIAGYVTRDGSLTDVVATVESVSRGETIVSPRLAALLFRRLAAQRRRDEIAVAETATAQLTSRKRQILMLIEQGMANKEIARTLGIELATVKNHVHRVLEKLNVSRRGQAAARLRADARPKA